MKKTALISLASLLLCAAMAAGCGGQNASPPASASGESASAAPASQAAPSGAPAEKKVVGLVLLDGAIEHCQFFDEGVRSVVEANGDEVVTLDGAYDVVKINQCIEDLIAREVDAIIVDALDKEGHVASIRMAQDAGILVVQSDNLCTNKDVIVGGAASDNYDAGYQCGLDAAKRITERGETGKALVLEMPGAPAPEARVEGFLAACEEKGIEVLAKQTAGGVELGASVTDDLIQGHPEANILFAQHDPAAMGAYSSLKTAGMIPQCLVYGVDGNTENKELIKQGEIAGTVQQDPRTMGAESAKFFYHVWNNEEYEKEVIIPITFINQENVDKYL